MPVDLVVELTDSIHALEELGEDFVLDIPVVDVETPFSLIKSEKGSLVIAGYASPYVVDKENHRIELSALRPALAKFMKNKAYRNCQLLHSNITVGRVIDSATDSKGRTWTTHVDDKGLFAVAIIDRGDLEVGRKVLEKIRDRTLDSWSIGGRALASKYICEDGKCFYSIQKLELYELTLCQQGKNPAAKFEILKADGLSYGSLMAQGTAEVKSSGHKMGKEIQLADTLKCFEKPILILREFVSLIGGLPIHGVTKGDVDLLIKKDHEEMMDIPIQFRLIRSIDPTLWDRIHWSYDTFHGPITSYVPLFDLWLVPSERSGEVIQMAKNPDTELAAVTKAGKEKAGPGKGWHGPPKGTHAAGEWNKKEISASLKEFETWTGMRRGYAIQASYRMGPREIRNPARDGFILKDKQEIVGVAIIRFTPKYVEIDRLATKRTGSGYGRAIMGEIRHKAKEKGLGIRLEPTPASAGFYRKIGMHREGKWFKWEMEDLEKAERTKFVPGDGAEILKDWDDEIRPEDEPETGIFTEPLADERSDKKKVTALAELQSAVIELAAAPKSKSSIYQIPESDWSSCGKPPDGN